MVRMHLNKAILFIFLPLFVVIFLAGLHSASALDNESVVTANFTPEYSTYTQGDKVVVNFTLKSNVDCSLTAFTLDLEFDSNKVTFAGIGQYITFGKDELSTYSKDVNSLRLLFVTGGKGISLKANTETNVLTFNFTSSDSQVGDCVIKSNIFDGVDAEPKSISIGCEPEFKFALNEYVEPDSRLKTLSSNVGKLSPEFDPDITQYAMDVSEDTSQVVMFATTQDENSKVTVSRKNLYKAGTQTPIIVTCKSSEGDTTQYTVTVYRALDEETDSSDGDKDKDKGKTDSNSGSNKEQGKDESTIDDSVAGYTIDGAGYTGGSRGSGGSTKTTTTVKRADSDSNPESFASGDLSGNTDSEQKEFFVERSRFVPFMLIVIALLIALVSGVIIYETRNKKKENLEEDVLVDLEESSSCEEGETKECLK